MGKRVLIDMGNVVRIRRPSWGKCDYFWFYVISWLGRWNWAGFWFCVQLEQRQMKNILER